MELSDAKKEMILKTIEVRLEVIGEATKRARLNFIIVIIASSTMIITLWNTYYSYTSNYAFDDSLEFRVIKFDLSKFIENLNQKKLLSQYLESEFSDETKNLLSKFNQLREKKDKSEIERNTENKISEELQKYIINELNTKLLTNTQLFTSQKFKNAYCESLKMSLENKEVLRKKFESEAFTQGVEALTIEMVEIQKKEKVCPQKSNDTIILDSDPEILTISNLLAKTNIELHPKITNHINNFLLNRAYEEIEWDIFSSSKNSPYVLPEQNKRGASLEWIKNQNVSVSILGINIHVNEFSFIGSSIITVISVWLFFSIRRENRSIVSLLRDVRKDLDRPSADQKVGDDSWDIANLAFHGIAHKLLFAHTGGTDKPMSIKDIFDEDTFYKNRFVYITDNFIRVLTKGIRSLVLLLLFLPVITIGITIYADIDSTYNSLSPYRINPEASFIQRNTDQMEIDIKRIINENLWALSLGLFTFLICIGCLIFQIRTTQALKEFEKRLDPGKFEEKRRLISKIKMLISGAFISDSFFK